MAFGVVLAAKPIFGFAQDKLLPGRLVSHDWFGGFFLDDWLGGGADEVA
jgi:hypothetical protein